MVWAAWAEGCDKVLFIRFRCWLSHAEPSGSELSAANVNGPFFLEFYSFLWKHADSAQQHSFAESFTAQSEWIHDKPEHFQSDVCLRTASGNHCSDSLYDSLHGRNESNRLVPNACSIHDAKGLQRHSWLQIHVLRTRQSRWIKILILNDYIFNSKTFFISNHY